MALINSGFFLFLFISFFEGLQKYTQNIYLCHNNIFFNETVLQ